MISSDIKKNYIEELDKKKEEESTSLLHPLMDDTNSFIHNIESPIMATNSSTFVFDDVPLITYMDSFPLFEAFGFWVMLMTQIFNIKNLYKINMIWF